MPWAREPWMRTGLTLLALAGGACLANWVAKRIVLKGVLRLLGRSPFEAEAQHVGAIVARLSNILPALIVQSGIAAVPGLPAELVAFVHSLSAAFIILTLALAVTTTLTLGNELYQRRPDAGNRPIKGYVQVANLLVYAAAAILVLAALMNQSPLLLLSGLGAMAAVLLLVFKDTILSLVASVQIGSNDMVRVGDWIEMPKLDANGDVIDIALHTVKVQNFDKTITTIPTHRLITESFRNWRGMSESGGRRIMRALMIDQTSIGFLDDEGLAKVARFGLLGDYLRDRQAQVRNWNERNAPSEILDARRLTNIGTYRAYVLAYLKARPDIAEDKTLLVRQLAPGEHGLPLEIYAFAATTAWAHYEDIQADIFDHLIAIMPEFGLRVFQHPTGADFAFVHAA
ncbi:mechanosensitive ion channel protein MscS [Novosphingobium sp. KA1]|nr:mechanosensitive ion channel protein MscS [Novosphingobium sp. KA1]